METELIIRTDRPTKYVVVDLALNELMVWSELLNRWVDVPRSTIVEVAKLAVDRLE